MVPAQSQESGRRMNKIWETQHKEKTYTHIFARLTQRFKHELHEELWALAAYSSYSNYEGLLRGFSAFLWLETGIGASGP